MLGIVVPLLVSWYVYKQAKENGYSGFWWAFINFVAFFVGQILFVMAVGLAIAIGTEFLGWDDDVLMKYAVPITLLSLIAGAVCSWLMVRRVTRAPEEKFDPEPPPPPRFN